ncbi:hypothetical protein JYU34_002879 [Plutella xylostella]|uniref:Uncharacterized protein n=1 Tax=Plutella xylostella TaxID=51655 RepID=A0ABQ7R3B7_PLUXY|nr:hypothetical protein JYU34_002879 [Plutella xylostella]
MRKIYLPAGGRAAWADDVSGVRQGAMLPPPLFNLTFGGGGGYIDPPQCRGRPPRPAPRRLFTSTNIEDNLIDLFRGYEIERIES